MVSKHYAMAPQKLNPSPNFEEKKMIFDATEYTYCH